MTSARLSTKPATFDRVNRDKRTHPVPPRTVMRRQLVHDANRVHLRVVSSREPGAPVTRADCASVPRPCPWVGCRYNLYLDVTRRGGLRLAFPDRGPEDMPHDGSCALDLADVAKRRGEANARLLLARALNLTREGVRQAIYRAIVRLVEHAPPEWGDSRAALARVRRMFVPLG